MKDRGSVWVGLVLASTLVLTGCGRLSAVAIDAAPDVADVTPTATAEAAEEMSADVGAHAVTELAGPTGTLVALDDEMYLYTNPDLGFSIEMPQQMALPFGRCVFNSEQDSYRPAFADVPTAVFEQGDTVYLTFAYYGELQGPTQTELEDGGRRQDYSGCVPVSNTLDLVLDPDSHYKQHWAVQVVSVRDETELESFIQDRYGTGCAVGEMQAATQEGVYDVVIAGDGKHFTESTCPINFRTVVKYDATRHKVAAWDLGQANTFAADWDYQIIYDHDMVDSFRFVD